MLWLFIFSAVIIFALLLFVAICHCCRKFRFIKKLSGNSKKKEILFSILLVTAFSICSFLLTKTFNAILIIIHLGFFMLLCNIIAFIIKKLHKRTLAEEKGISAEGQKPYYPGLAAIILTVLYLGYGWLSCHTVQQTSYTLTSEKVSSALRIVQISDSHVGTTFNSEGFAKELKKIQVQNPDVIVITGDFVDDSTTLEDMKGACAALGQLSTTYGIYYVFGNHDKGYYSSASRGYNADMLVSELAKNGVTVLEDDIVELNDNYCLIGRQDRSESHRATMEALTLELTDTQYYIVLDHQPNDYTAEEQSGVDLVLSGHTHGGNFLPVRRLGELLGQNDKTYGLKTRSNTTFIVSSGISDWASDFKTGCISEYVVIDILPAE